MLARTAFRATAGPSLVARRGFQSTRQQLSSPYHYPEGPRSNLPFDPLKKGFAFKYWGFMGELCRRSMAPSPLTLAATGFFLPFGLAGEPPTHARTSLCASDLTLAAQFGRRRRTSRRRARHAIVRGSRAATREESGTCSISGRSQERLYTMTSLNFIWPCSFVPSSPPSLLP